VHVEHAHERGREDDGEAVGREQDHRAQRGQRREDHQQRALREPVAHEEGEGGGEGRAPERRRENGADLRRREAEARGVQADQDRHQPDGEGAQEGGGVEGAPERARGHARMIRAAR
jgi:hypothetical protein